jgi:hypothetical protein
MENENEVLIAYRGQLSNLLNGCVSVEEMKVNLKKHEKKERYEVCEGIILAIKEFEKTLD